MIFVGDDWAEDHHDGRKHDWTPKHIESRQKDLAKLAVAVWPR